MNYIIGILVFLAIVVCIAAFPVPALIALAIAGAWWGIKGRKGRVR